MVLLEEWRHPFGTAMTFAVVGLREGTRVVTDSPILCIDHGSHSLGMDRDRIGQDMDDQKEVNPLDGSIAPQAWTAGTEKHVCVSPFFS